MVNYIRNILEGIRVSIEDDIYPNTIRIHPIDLFKLKLEIKNCQLGDIVTILGMRIEETVKVEVGKAELYNDKLLEKLKW